MNWEEVLTTVFNDYIIYYGLRIISAVLILVIGFKAIKIFTDALYKKRQTKFQSETTFKFIVSLLSITLKIVLFVITASIVGIPSASFVAILGSAGVAVGLALQGGLSNLAGGVMLIFFKPYAIGDFVEINSQSGTVSDIGIFYTSILSLDNRKIVIPNSIATSNIVKNYSAEKNAQIVIDLSASYNDGIEKVKSVLRKIADEDPRVIHDMPVTVYVMSHAESGINYSFRCWCKTEDYWSLRDSLYEKAKEAFDRENIEIPYNKLEVSVTERK